MDDSNNIIRIIPKAKIDNARFRQTVNEFIDHAKKDNNLEEPARIYIYIATRAWIAYVGYARFKEILLGLLITLEEEDEKGTFD